MKQRAGTSEFLSVLVDPFVRHWNCQWKSITTLKYNIVANINHYPISIQWELDKQRAEYARLHLHWGEDCTKRQQHLSWAVILHSTQGKQWHHQPRRHSAKSCWKNSQIWGTEPRIQWPIATEVWINLRKKAT